MYQAIQIRLQNINPINQAIRDGCFGKLSLETKTQQIPFRQELRTSKRTQLIDDRFQLFIGIIMDVDGSCAVF